MGPRARREYVQEMRRRYAAAGRAERSRLLDELTTVVGYHRKYAIGLMAAPVPSRPLRRERSSRFGPEVVAALLAVWRAADYPWSRRLVALLPIWMPWMRIRLSLAPLTEATLLTISPRSVDRLLHPHRVELRRRLYGRTKPGTLLKHQIPIRSERWDTREIGWCETDTVAHCGESSDGEFAFSVNLSDVASTWTETRAVLGKGQRFVVAALEEIRSSLPFVLQGLDSDSGSEFINNHCVDWCTKHGLQFTRSRPYHKNDNAHIEQKNWTHVRKIFGWKRLDSEAAVQAMNALYRHELRLFLNYFQPSVKLLERVRTGSRIRRRYDDPKTPFERLVALGALTPQQIDRMRAERDALDPFALSAAIEAQVSAVLDLPQTSPVKRRPVKPDAWERTPLSRRTDARNAARATAPVRSHAAR